MKCKFIRPNGKQCNGNAMSGVNYCYTHNPNISDEEKLEAKRRGGRARALTLTNPLPVLPINTPDDVILLIVDTISRVRAGELDIKTANCLFIGSEKLLKAFEVARLSDKAEFIEQVILKGAIR